MRQAMDAAPSASRARPTRLVAGLVAMVLAATLMRADAAPASAQVRADAPWGWPLTSFALVEPFAAPPHRYGAGHRGIDLRSIADGTVLAPAAGVVAFAGSVVDRGIITIDHGDGYVTTLEPVEQQIAEGSVVARGDAIAVVSAGGHAAAGALHFGVRLHGEYINPLVLLGGVPRAVLLPCC